MKAEVKRPFIISKQSVWQSYKSMKANRGSAGVDEVSIKEFDKDLKDNLYKLWARLSSGSYMPPPVRLVEIDKPDGGKRPLGIPTVSDRIAQGVVKQALEGAMDKLFHKDSYGYRPKKSALEAVGICRQRCWQYDWVLDLDIKGFFDNIPHDLMMKAVEKHTNCKWHLLYIKRWLVAPLQDKDGKQYERTKGTPQGSVISPLLSNLFLHYCLDIWMERHYPYCPFERYADDMIIHCKSEFEAQKLKEEIGNRLQECGLQMHPEKTKIVYCKDDKRGGNYENVTFDFLGYGFHPRRSRNLRGVQFVAFTPAISKKACKRIGVEIRKSKQLKLSNNDLSDISSELNSKVRGWINYYGKYCRSKLFQSVLHQLDLRIARWAKRKYKRLKGNMLSGIDWMEKMRKAEPFQFEHWWLYRVSPG